VPNPAGYSTAPTAAAVNKAGATDGDRRRTADHDKKGIVTRQAIDPIMVAIETIVFMISGVPE